MRGTDACTIFLRTYRNQRTVEYVSKNRSEASRKKKKENLAEPRSFVSQRTFSVGFPRREFDTVFSRTIVHNGTKIDS
jgi:hypothetical protein